jgi:putative hemolysin
MNTVFIISSSIAVVVSFLCSLAESLLLSLNPITLNRLQAKHPVSARSWRKLKSNIARPITAILVLNTISHTGGATVAGGAFSELYGDENIWIFSVLFTIVVLFGTEIFPKIIGVTLRDQLAPVAGPILQFLTTVLSPVIWLSEKIFKRLINDNESDQITTSDLITFASLAKSGKSISMEQENIIVNSIRLSHTELKSAMIPPEKIQFIRNTDSAEAIGAFAARTGHTRYPISRSAEAKDIYAYIVIKKAVQPSGDEISRLMLNARPIQTVNHRDDLLHALRKMIEKKEHMMAVIDERRECVGIITLEDVTSELISADIERFT